MGRRALIFRKICPSFLSLTVCVVNWRLLVFRKVCPPFFCPVSLLLDGPACTHLQKDLPIFSFPDSVCGQLGSRSHQREKQNQVKFLHLPMRLSNAPYTHFLCAGCDTFVLDLKCKNRCG